MPDPTQPAGPRARQAPPCSASALRPSLLGDLLEGATSLENEAGLQIALCAAALVTLAGLLFSPRVRLRAPVKAFAGLGLLVLFAVWSGISIDWSIAPDLSWVQLNRWGPTRSSSRWRSCSGRASGAPHSGRPSGSS